MTRPGIVVLGLLVACSGSQDNPQPRPITTIAEASAKPAPEPAPSASVAPEPEIPEEYAAWTDPYPLAQLAKDCAWKPPEPTEEEKAIGASHPMGCERIPEQICQADACLGTAYECFPECNKTCGGCGEACVSSCESCKSTCKDDACRKACAQKCGECHQQCVVGLDHCTTGHCSEVMADCGKKELAEWRKASCDKVCEKVSECANNCYGDEGGVHGKCGDACKKKHMNARCPDKWFYVCIGYAQSPESLFGQPVP
jgi:hypothetical protein